MNFTNKNKESNGKRLCVLAANSKIYEIAMGVDGTTLRGPENGKTLCTLPLSALFLFLKEDGGGGGSEGRARIGFYLSPKSV